MMTTTFSMSTRGMCSGMMKGMCMSMCMKTEKICGASDVYKREKSTGIIFAMVPVIFLQ